jgi:pSer/pThr/pTyr-binding forkhead associated (FHA) protein
VRYRVRCGDRVAAVTPGEEGLVVGRGESCGLVLDDPTASRQHVRLRVDGDGRLSVEDLGSANGYVLNSVRSRGRCVLTHGDRLTVGRSVLVVTDARERSQTTQQASPKTMTVAPSDTEVRALEAALQRSSLPEAIELAAVAVHKARKERLATDVFVRLEGALVALGSHDAAWLTHVLELCGARQAVPATATITRMHELARAGRGVDASAVKRYLATMAPVATSLPTATQLQVRRVETLLRSGGSDG